MFVEGGEVPGGDKGEEDWRGLAVWSVGRMRRDVEGWVAEKEVISQIIACLKTFSRVGRVRHGLLVCGILLYPPLASEINHSENMPDFIQYLMAHISDLPQASHSSLPYVLFPYKS